MFRLRGSGYTGTPDHNDREIAERRGGLRKRPNILILAGSIRTGAYSQQTANAFAAELVNHECEITRITLADYPLPMMDEDLEKEKGIPENAIRLAKLFHRNNAVIFVSPEYNGSLPPLLKNAIDWISRVSGDGGTGITPYRDKLCAIATSSPGAMGGVSCLGHLRTILVRLGMQVISEQVAIGNAGSAFDKSGRLGSERHAALMSRTCTSLVEKATLLG